MVPIGNNETAVKISTTQNVEILIEGMITEEKVEVIEEILTEIGIQDIKTTETIIGVATTIEVKDIVEEAIHLAVALAHQMIVILQIHQGLGVGIETDANKDLHHPLKHQIARKSLHQYQRDQRVKILIRATALENFK